MYKHILLPTDGSKLSDKGVRQAIKMARAATGRPRIIYCDHGFHGLTMGAISVNGNPEFRERYGPFLPGCDPVPFGDLDALRSELERGSPGHLLRPRGGAEQEESEKNSPRGAGPGGGYRHIEILASGGPGGASGAPGMTASSSVAGTS